MDVHIAELFLEAKEQILDSEEYSTRHKIKALFNLLTSILEEVTQSEKIVFTTLFSRATFMANRYKVDSKLMYLVHTFRRGNERMRIGASADYYLTLGNYVIDGLIDWLCFERSPTSKLDADVLQYFESDHNEVDRFKPVVEAIIESIDNEGYIVHFYDEEDGANLKKAYFDRSDKNELFNDNLHLASQLFDFPVHANFIDVEIMSDGSYLPAALVLMPDYLMDVTAVANCFKDFGANSMLRIVSKFKQLENSIPLTVGNIANLFLDEIVSDPSVKFNSLLPKMFKLDPIGLSNFNDGEIRELVDNVKNHYLNLKKSVAIELPAQGIRRDRVFLEPSFYSRDYGLQGRLDLFHVHKEANQYDIVELKSGKPFRPNVYGLSASHYSQTLLYDLMIKSAFGYHFKPNNYILYSKLKEKSLKYAPPVKSQQYEAMRIRNELVAIEYKMAKSADDVGQLLIHLAHAKYEKLKGFELKDLERFQKFYIGLKGHEADYFNSCCSFIAREHRMAKTGENGVLRSSGLASLWLENIEEKEDRFGILQRLIIQNNNSEAEVPTIVLSRDHQFSTLANFRVGDIVVLYPMVAQTRAVLKNQIFKCTIVRIDKNDVEVKLRSKQYNHSLFKSVDYWNIEADTLDSGFNTLYRSLFEFCRAKTDTRDLWLGVRPPRRAFIKDHKAIEGLTNEQNEVLNRMIDAEDYFLLWGPPGTGKTSVMLKSLTQRLMNSTEENILLLAYTNRAVDEICAAVESIGEDWSERYVRLGSSTSCGQRFKPRLLDNLISVKSTRQEIKKMIGEQRIFISTVSSITTKIDLFRLKKFDRVIVDEASQILEPMLLGLLSRIDKSVLIGDHKQLPAVVTQGAESTKVKSDRLKALGITDSSMSLFERLYHRCISQDWKHCVGLLSLQGRMHTEIMHFANQYFYEGKLSVLPGLERLTKNREYQSDSETGSLLVSQRFIYNNTQIERAINWKTNRHEAESVVRFVKNIEEIYRFNNRVIQKNSIGIITPYRAQIATIRKNFEEEAPHLLEDITIDTVERYQGGARDIIILSLCTNRLSQLKSLVSISEEGIDRKLNVAITRAREQLIVLGNREILETNNTYRELIQTAYEWHLW